jgi:hypothetical protein
VTYLVAKKIVRDDTGLPEFCHDVLALPTVCHVTLSFNFLSFLSKYDSFRAYKVIISGRNCGKCRVRRRVNEVESMRLIYGLSKSRNKGPRGLQSLRETVDITICVA